jgi:pimeloyl-ACP methyl ester carboxylesterase
LCGSGLPDEPAEQRPIVDALGGSVRTIAVDLPAHGESAGPPASVEEVARRLRYLLGTLEIADPIMVGHSYGAAVAGVYTANNPSSGLAMIDSGPAVQPFAELAQRAGPGLRGPDFAATWQMFESSLGLERIPEPAQSLVRATHRVEQAVVLAYWHQMLTTPPAEVQALIDSEFARIDRPVLAIFGSTTPEADRQRLQRLRDVRIQE